MSKNKEPPKNGNKDYEVGWGKPPKHTRWQKGYCPNPKGRPKGSKSFARDLAEELQERIHLTENGNRKTVTKQRAIIKRLISDSLQGDNKARAILLSLYEGSNDEIEKAIEEPKPLPESDREILERYFETKFLPDYLDSVVTRLKI